MNFITKKLNHLLKSLEPISYPSLINSFIYLIIPLLVLLILNKKIDFLPYIPSLYIKILISLFGATYAYKDLSPYIRNVVNFKTTLKVSAKLMVLYGIFIFIALFFTGDDPQNIKNLNLSNKEYFLHILELPFTAIGEEVMKALMLFALLKVFKPFNNFNIPIAILISSAIFGLLHINYNYDNAIKIIFAIGFTSIPDSLYFLKYKSIYPLIIVHFIADFLALSNISQNFSLIVTLAQLSMLLAIIFFIPISFFFNKKNN